MSQDTHTKERLLRVVPFDPITKSSEAFAVDGDGLELITKGAFEVIARIAEVPTDARRLVDALAQQGNRVLAVAAEATQSTAFGRSHRAR
jgi:magnesium-transporting ATPase (P-type)